MTLRTFSSILPFTRRFGVRGVTCMTNGALGGGSDCVSQPVCKNCETSIMRCENFCSRCGTPVPESDKVSHPRVKPKVDEIRLSFGYSSSANYGAAVEICKKIPSYSESGEGKQIRHEVVLLATDAGLALTIHNLICGWKSSHMQIGKLCHANRGDLNMHGLECYRNWQRTYDPDEYCAGAHEFEANIWGCKNLRMPHQLVRGWLNDGHMDDRGVWHVNKQKIRFDLVVRAGHCKFCPVFDLGRVLQILDDIPSQIDPRRDPNWEYKTGLEKTEDGDYREVKVGIRPASHG